MTTDSIEAKSLSKRIQLVAPFLFSILLLNTSSAQNHEELGARRPSIPITKSALYSAAQRASVQVLITDEHQLIPAGSGVWIEKDIVATCFHVVKDSNGPVVVRVLSGSHFNVAAHHKSKPQITV